jgi:signal peptidase I
LSQEVAAPPTEESQESKGSSAWKFLRELPVLVALALGIALLIKTFLVQAFFIPSASMEPTLTLGDRVLVSKLSYRFGEPDRGDLIVFKDPNNPCDAPGASQRPECNPSIPRRALSWVGESFGLPTGVTKDFIKRIIALPGETVEIRDGQVYVCESPCVPLDEDGRPQDGELVEIESSADRGPRLDSDNVAPVRVPNDSYWVMGDNRGNSSDSRVFGSISEEEIVGKAFVLIWPPTRFGTF